MENISDLPITLWPGTHLLYVGIEDSLGGQRPFPQSPSEFQQGQGQDGIFLDTGDLQGEDEGDARTAVPVTLWLRGSKSLELCQHLSTDLAGKMDPACGASDLLLLSVSS